jgi:hypothetical protein
MNKKSGKLVLALFLTALANACAYSQSDPLREAPNESAKIVFYGKGRIKSPDDQSYALIRKSGSSMIISGNGEDVPVDELKKSFKSDFIWFRDGNETYVIVDPSFMERANMAWTGYDAASDMLSSTRRQLRTHEKLLTRMESIEENRKSFTRNASMDSEDDREAKLQNERAIIREITRSKEILEKKCSSELENAKLEMRTLIREARQSGKLSNFRATQEN